VLSYEPGQEFRQHVDYLDPQIPAYQAELSMIGQRVATALTWLNDDFDGGETEFVRANVRFRRKPPVTVGARQSPGDRLSHGH
jgi:prolyl 4-hydroxylase